MQGTGQLNLCVMFMLDEPLCLLLFDTTCRVLYLGSWGSPRAPLSCQQRNLSPFSLSPSVLGEEGGTCVSACIFSEMTGYSISSVSLSLSSIHLSLPTSSWSSGTKLRSFSAWVHLPQLCSLLPGTGIRQGTPSSLQRYGCRWMW